MRDNDKYLLILLITIAVWQFYSTGWLQQPWTTADIYFLTENRREKREGIFIDEPFLIPSFDHDTHNTPDTTQSTALEALQSLGTMLLEIELGTLMEQKESEFLDLRAWKGPRYRRALYTAKRLIKDQKSLRHSPNVLQGIIKKCLEPDSFAIYINNPDNLRAAMKREIISPLLGFSHYIYRDIEQAEVREAIVASSGLVQSSTASRLVLTPLALS